MATKVDNLKPFCLEERKEGSNNKVSEVSVNKWQGYILTNVKKIEEWLKFLPKEDKPIWAQKKTPDRGFDEGTDALQLNDMLEYISQYAPDCLYRDITLCSRPLQEVWTLVRDWAGIKAVSCYHQIYFKTKHSYDPDDKTQSPVNFYFELRNAKEDCLLHSAGSGGKVTFRGELPNVDEVLTATMSFESLIKI